MSDLESCFASGSLKKISPDIKKAANSLKIAEIQRGKAKEALKAGLCDLALVAAYTVMFHSARSLLFKDGVKERSHYCLCAYIKEKYRGTIEAKYINELDILRGQRHRALYGDEEVTLKEVEKSEAESAVNTAEGFLNAARELIKKG